MTFCTVFLMGLQLFWNYQSYRSNVRVFKSDINDALDKAVNRLMDIRRDEFSARYKTWLADTSLFDVQGSYLDTLKSTKFILSDKHPIYHNRAPFYIGFDYPDKNLKHITPQARQFFINTFVTNLISRDLQSGSAYYYTQRLGDSLSQAFKNDRMNVKQLELLYQEELAKREIDNAFNLHVSTYSFTNFSTPNEALAGHPYSTRQFKYGFYQPLAGINAYFPNPSLVFIQKMKWVLLSSLLLIAITIFCFTYTVKTMLSQRQLAQLKDDFVNNMTHELKTPVATISIAAEAIQNFDLNKVSVSEYLSIIRYQAGNLTTVIEQILSSMLNGQAVIKLNPKIISLNMILNNCLEQYRPQLLVSNTHLTLHVDETPILVNGDATHLGNVIANLLDNAIKYGTEQPVIGITIYTEQDNAFFKITNDGKGIPKEYQDKVFERFFRVPTGNIHNVKGYGLGLSYVKDIILRHGGQIKVNSETSATAFIIQLPLIKHEISQSITA
jgi:two-component system phosphate regulon sensor histidine kinase PhoR